MLGGLFEEDDSGGDGWEDSGVESGASGRTGRPPERRSVGAKFAGLQNQGGTCYLNALLQTLFMLKPFRDAVLAAPLQDSKLRNDQRSGASGSSLVLLRELQGLFARMLYSEQAAVSTHDLTRRAFSWAGGQASEQHDVHELVTALLTRLHGELSQYQNQLQDEVVVGPPLSSSLVKDMFIGTSCDSALKCTKCGHESGQATPFMTLFAVVAGHATLEESLAATYCAEPEPVEGCECDGCGGVKVTKELRAQLREVPPALFISLRRFEFNYNTMRRTKINTRFEFPVSLDMTPYITTRSDKSSGDEDTDEDTEGSNPENKAKIEFVMNCEAMIYDLVAIISHAGGSGFSGHYICFVRTSEEPPKAEEEGEKRPCIEAWSTVEPKNKGKGKGKGKGKNQALLFANPDAWGSWYKFDDTRVGPVATEEIASTFSGRCCAYMLLYTRREQGSDLPSFHFQGPSLGLENPTMPTWLNDKMKEENADFQEAWRAHDIESNSCSFAVFTPSQLSRRGLHWAVNGDSNAGLSASSTSSKPGTNVPKLVKMDKRISLNECISAICEEITHDALSGSWSVILLKAHGPGYYNAATLFPSDHHTLGEALEQCGDCKVGVPTLLLVKAKSGRKMADFQVCPEPILLTLHVFSSSSQREPTSLTIFYRVGESEQSELWHAVFGQLPSDLAVLQQECTLYLSSATHNVLTKIEKDASPVRVVEVKEGSEIFACTCNDARDSPNNFISRRARTIHVKIKASSTLAQNFCEESSYDGDWSSLNCDPLEQVDIESLLTAAKKVLHIKPDCATILVDAKKKPIREISQLEKAHRYTLADESEFATFGKLQLDKTQASTKDSRHLVPKMISVSCRVVNRADNLKSEVFQVDIESWRPIHDLKVMALERAQSSPEVTERPHRVRLTNWAGEAQGLVEEAVYQVQLTDDGRAARCFSTLFAKRAVPDRAQALFLLFGESGRAMVSESSFVNNLAWFGGAVDMATAAQPEHTVRQFESWWSNVSGRIDWGIVSPPEQRSLSDAYADICGSEALLIEEGPAPTVGAAKIDLYIWAADGNEGRCWKVASVRILSSQTKALKQVLARELLASLTIKEEDRADTDDCITNRDERLALATILSGVEAVVFRDLNLESAARSSALSGSQPKPHLLPGPTINWKSLAARMKKKDVTLPIPLAICLQAQHALSPSSISFSAIEGLPKRGKKSKGKSAQVSRRVAVWIGQLKTTPSRSFSKVQELVASSLSEAANLAVTKLGLKRAIVARYDPFNHKWELSQRQADGHFFFDRTCAAVDDATLLPSGKKSTKTAKKGNAASGRKLCDGDFLAVLSADDPALVGPAKRSKNELEVLFDSDADRAGQAFLKEARDSRQKSKKSYWTSTPGLTRPETALNLGSDAFFGVDFAS